MNHAYAVAPDRGNHDMLFHRVKFYRMGACQGVCRALKVAIFPAEWFSCFPEAWLLLSRP